MGKLFTAVAGSMGTICAGIPTGTGPAAVCPAAALPTPMSATALNPAISERTGTFKGILLFVRP
jgi:hypothetical protein